MRMQLGIQFPYYNRVAKKLADNIVLLKMLYFVTNPIYRFLAC